MQAEGDMSNMARPTEAPAMSPRPAASNPMTQGPANEKKSNGMLIGLILCIVIALGGIGFGVWAMMDGNTQVNSLNDQIGTLKKQNSDLSNQVAELQATIENYENNDNGETVLVEWGTAEAEVVDGVFYIKSEDGETIAQDDSVEVVEIVSCDSGTVDAPSPLICSVTTADGQGKFVYSYDDGSLSFTAVSE